MSQPNGESLVSQPATQEKKPIPVKLSRREILARMGWGGGGLILGGLLGNKVNFGVPSPANNPTVNSEATQAVVEGSLGPTVTAQQLTERLEKLGEVYPEVYSRRDSISALFDGWNFDQPASFPPQAAEVHLRARFAPITEYQGTQIYDTLSPDIRPTAAINLKNGHLPAAELAGEYDFVNFLPEKLLATFQDQKSQVVEQLNEPAVVAELNNLEMEVVSPTFPLSEVLQKVGGSPELLPPGSKMSQDKLQIRFAMERNLYFYPKIEGEADYRPGFMLAQKIDILLPDEHGVPQLLYSLDLPIQPATGTVSPHIHRSGEFMSLVGVVPNGGKWLNLEQIADFFTAAFTQYSPIK